MVWSLASSSFEVISPHFSGVGLHTSVVYTGVVRNITFSADEELIERAREVARRNQRTLNEEFREWLKQYADTHAERRKMSIVELVSQMKPVKMGRKLSREEMNERR